MNTVLTIGTHRFVLASAAVAQAIRETLEAAPQVDRIYNPRRHGMCDFPPASYNKTVTVFSVESATREQLLLGPQPVAAGRFATVVLGEPAKTGRKTRGVLATAAGESKQ